MRENLFRGARWQQEQIVDERASCWDDFGWWLDRQAFSGPRPTFAKAIQWLDDNYTGCTPKAIIWSATAPAWQVDAARNLRRFYVRIHNRPVRIPDGGLWDL